MEDNPDVRVSFELNGTSYDDVGRADFSDDIASTLHHPWVRKWFHFQPVQLETPETCTL